MHPQAQSRHFNALTVDLASPLITLSWTNKHPCQDRSSTAPPIKHLAFCGSLGKMANQMPRSHRGEGESALCPDLPNLTNGNAALLEEVEVTGGDPSSSASHIKESAVEQVGRAGGQPQPMGADGKEGGSITPKSSANVAVKWDVSIIYLPVCP
ncbi:hypothetical protein JOQ06_013055 [Pogonophryne albipinna]|uniref:Uncharacterized protein n=1 Tax=Pogonophryne albipinna TaxID=1090488 RepID=A0AAD6FQR9_9TELE|nr:hypothetical protein JOQ06_013055 [Pogonophryne albipinna]